MNSLCASYKESGEVKMCMPYSTLCTWGDSHKGKTFKAPWNYAPGKTKIVTVIVKECQCYDA